MKTILSIFTLVLFAIPSVIFAEPINRIMLLGENLTVDSNLETEVNATVSNKLNTYPTEDYMDKNDFGISVVQSSQVSTQTDLEVFSANLPMQNKNVKKVETNTDVNGVTTVEVGYKHQGMLFGLIPVSFVTYTKVMSSDNGSFVVKSPATIWGKLVSNKSYDTNKIETRISNNPTVKANIRMNASAEAKARIAEAMVSELDLNETEGIAVN